MMSAAEASNMSKSITRLLQHSILQLCNEHIGYTHKLQILGVLCMTVDDEQQELVVKVNNTLKRVNQSGSKEPSPPHLPPLAQMGSSPFESRDSSFSQQYSTQQQQQQQHNFSHQLQQQTQQQPSPQQNSSPVRHKPENSQNETPSGRRAHGRKGNNPVKVHQVYDEAEPTSDDEEEPITVIPEAPEASLAFPLQRNLVAIESPAAGASSANGSSQRHIAGPASAEKSAGSARRKPSQQFRVPQYFKTPSNSPFQGNQYRPGSEGGSPVKNEAMADGEDSLSPKPTKGLSLPIYVAGTYDPEANNGENGDDNSDDGVEPIELNGNHEEGDSSSNGLNLSITSSKVKIKKEPADENEYQAMDLSGSETAMKFSNLFSSHGLMKNNNMLHHSIDGLPTQVPFAMLGSALLGTGYPLHGSPFNLPDVDGLTIKYTNTGPYTVGANGKDVSNSSRIKDIILYDEHSPLNQQKGNRIETDYIVDKLGMDGRKRRRRAPEDQLTAEEVAEYLGHEGDAYCFKCKYCTDEFDSVTRYIHHSLSMHQAYICHQCGKSFTTKSSLLRHRPIHTGMRRFACSICKKTFYRKDKCKAHIKRHLGLDTNDKAAAMEQYDKAAAMDQVALDHYDKVALEQTAVLEPYEKAAKLEHLSLEQIAKNTVEKLQKSAGKRMAKSAAEEFQKANMEQLEKPAVEPSEKAADESSERAVAELSDAEQSDKSDNAALEQSSLE